MAWRIAAVGWVTVSLRKSITPPLASLMGGSSGNRPRSESRNPFRKNGSQSSNAAL
jgi:hypothetical protein